MRARARRLPALVPRLAGLTAPERAALPAVWQPLLARLHDDLVALLGSDCRHVERIEIEPQPDGGLRLAPVFLHGIGARRPDAIARVVQRLAQAAAESQAPQAAVDAAVGPDAAGPADAAGGPR